MSVIHSLVRYAQGGVTGIQSAQRDWSPYLVHFTSFKAMDPLRNALREQLSPQEIERRLLIADEKSMEVFRKICASGRLLARSPSPDDNIPECVCLSECSLPGLISHCERYGRFGFVFQKQSIFARGGSPCFYVREEHYAVLSQVFEDERNTTHKAIWGLANLLAPAGARGGRVQDFSHEREWRVFDDVNLQETRPDYLIAPRLHQQIVAETLQGTPVIPIDTLFEWGA